MIWRLGSMVARLCQSWISPLKSKATVSKLLITCRLRRARVACHTARSLPCVKLNTGMMGLAHHDRMVSSSLYLGRMGSRASITYNAVSLLISWRSTLASCA